MNCLCWIDEQCELIVCIGARVSVEVAISMGCSRERVIESMVLSGTIGSQQECLLGTMDASNEVSRPKTPGQTHSPSPFSARRRQLRHNYSFATRL